MEFCWFGSGMKILAVLFCLMGVLGAEELKVVALHPLVADLLRQVGGDKVEVIDLLGKDKDPHSFEPQAEDLMAAKGAEAYFLSGMGLESYLTKLKSILKGEADIIEVGSSLPALHGACDHEEHEGHEHHHDEHDLDPHWWHSVDNFRRATSVVATELTKLRPEHEEYFAANAMVYRAKLDELEKWVKREVVGIPKERRKLATAHEAFQYFCDAYGFESFSLQGLNREQMPDAVSLAKLIAELKEEKVVAIFPEKESNPKMLESLTRDTGMKLGGELVADGRGMNSYEAMIRGNVKVIVDALGE